MRASFGLFEKWETRLAMGTRGHGGLAKRYRQIADVCARHGLGFIIGVAGLDRLVPLQRGWLGHPQRELPYTRPEHVRMALEELGTVFIKLGQMLSTRADLLPPEYLAEFAKLQDSAPSVDVAEVIDAIVTELGQPPDEVFASFDPSPLAAASIGQVHAVTLIDGTDAVVKVRRPGVVEQVEMDLEILEQLARSAMRRWEPASHYDLVGLVQEFAESLRAELDYRQEGRNAERVAANFSENQLVHVPRIVWEATTSRVLTMERVHGIKIADIEALDIAGIDRKALAEHAAEVVLQMVFEDGFFHADPHPGNIFIEPDGRIALIDFGMVGVLDAQLQDQLVTLFVAVATRDPDRLVDAVLDLSQSRVRVDRARLRQDLQRLVRRYIDRPLKEIEATAVVEEVLEVVRRHQLQLPTNLLLVVRTAVMVEGLGAMLDPEFELTQAIEPYARHLALRRYSPLVWGRRLSAAGIDAMSLSMDLPLRMRRILTDLERGTFEVGMRPTGVDPLLDRLERIANRVVLGLIAAAFINGLAVLMSVYHPQGSDRWLGIFFAVGLTLAGTLGVYLTWSVIRSGRP